MINRRNFLAGLFGAGISAFSGRLFASTPQDNRRQHVQWNKLTADLIAGDGLDPLIASRTFLLLNVSQYLASEAVNGDESSVAPALEIGGYLALKETFPDNDMVRSLGRGISSYQRRPRLSEAGERVRRFLELRAGDGSSSRIQAIPPEGDTYWRSLENRPPLRPHWGNVKPFGALPLVKAPTPPRVGSEDFIRELHEVERKSSSLSQVDSDRVRFWGDGIGTATPVGHWMQILLEEFDRIEIALSEQLRLTSIISAALFNAGIRCWETKFTYWTPRPSQLSSNVRVHLHIPNFPAYTSGHSAFSWAAVAAMPTEMEERTIRWYELATEASESRVLAGIHYPCDCIGGAELGRVVGRATSETLRTSGGVAEWALRDAA